MTQLSRVIGITFMFPSMCIAMTEAWKDLAELELEQLLDIKVSVAARKQEPWLSASGTVYVIDRADIAHYGWRDMKEILSAIPNMDMFYQWGWLPGGQRGFTGNMSGTLLLIDGREVQNLLANEAFIMNNFPAHRIERVEVLQGPNSTLYGGNAAQGVINIVTRLATNENITDAGFILGEVGTRQIHGLVNRRENDLAFGISVSYFESDLNYRELRNFVFDDARYSRNADLDPIRDHNASRFRNNEKSISVDGYFSLHSFYGGTNLTRTENVSGIERVAVDYVNGDDSNRGYTLLYIGQNFAPTDEWQGFIELSQFDEYKEKWRQKVRNANTANSYDELIIFTEREDIGPSTRLRLRSQWQYQPSADEDWIFGYDGWKTDIGSKVSYVETMNGTELQTPATWPTSKEKSDKQAIYSQFAKRWNIANESQLHMTLGLRFNRQDFTDDALLPRLSMVYQTDALSAWKFTYGEAFRPPTIFEFDGVVDDSLDSQSLTMYELNHSKRWRWENIEFTNSASLYQMTAENFYQKIFDTTGGFWRTEVAGQHRVNGIEDMLRWQTPRWQGFVGARYIEPDATTINGQTEFLDVPVSKIKLGLSYGVSDNWRVGTFVDRWAHTYTEANTLDGSATEIYRIPSWTVVNLNVLFTAWQTANSIRTSIGLYVENVFDKTYYHANARGTSPIQFIQAPRNARLQVSMLF